MADTDPRLSSKATAQDAGAAAPAAPKAAGISQALRRLACAAGRHLSSATKTLDAVSKLDEVTKRVQEWF